MKDAMKNQNREGMDAIADIPCDNLFAKLDALTSKSQWWIHCACNQAAECGDYILDPECRDECEKAGLLKKMPFGKIEFSPGVMETVYSNGYFLSKPIANA